MIIPEDDFINASFDHEHGVDTTDVLFFLTSPRSGSTHLCDLMYRNGHVLAHEYFQPHQYLPLLLERWKCGSDSEIDFPKFVRQLKRYRTQKNGWLGVNLHGEHIKLFLQALPEFSECRKHYIYLRRKDEIAQAISFHIALETGNWSSDYRRSSIVEYDFAKIKRRLEKLHENNDIIQAFLREKKYLDFYYEDVVADREAFLLKVPGIETSKLIFESSLKSQKDEKKIAFTRLFSNELLSMEDSEDNDPNGKRESSNIFRRTVSLALRKIITEGKS